MRWERQGKNVRVIVGFSRAYGWLRRDQVTGENYEERLEYSRNGRPWQGARVHSWMHQAVWNNMRDFLKDNE